jgi:UDP-N-acetylglucosamine 1-carboxyvinyltransferase
MDIKIQGGQTLSGDITPSGSKNSALAVLTASIIFHEPIVLENIPNLSDITTVVGILEKLGSKITWNKQAHEMHIDNSDIEFRRFGKDDLGDMKGTSMFWGAMLARFGKTDFEDLPGGCALGARPVDTHYLALQDLGVEVKETETGVVMDAAGAKPGAVWLTEMSPTATANVISLAVNLKGTTKIIGAASEPSVQDLCNLLAAAGASIEGIGSNTLTIEGGAALHTVNYRILSDHYEIATFLALGACTGKKVRVHDALPDYFPMIRREFAKFNINIAYDGDTAFLDNGTKVGMGQDPGHTTLIKPQPWPALPVDMLPLFIPLALKSPGGSALFHNWMYESGLFWTSELLKFGANVTILDPHRVMTIAGNELRGAKVVAPYIIRATVALIMVALIAEGKSTILNADSLDRGHENFVENLKRLGAEIERVG